MVALVTLRRVARGSVGRDGSAWRAWAI